VSSDTDVRVADDVRSLINEPNSSDNNALLIRTDFLRNMSMDGQFMSTLCFMKIDGADLLIGVGG